MDLSERRKANKKIVQEAVEKERKRRNRNTAAFIIALIIFIVLMIYILTPSFVTKPDIEKPELSSSNEINNNHVNWALNEAGAYRLHRTSYFFGEPPVMEIVITDDSKIFTTTVINNNPVTEQGPAQNPDLRFSMNSESFVELYSSNNILSKASEMEENGLITVEVFKDYDTMRAKGYTIIYSSVR